MIHFQSRRHKLVYEVHHLAGLETDVTQHALPHLLHVLTKFFFFFYRTLLFYDWREYIHDSEGVFLGTVKRSLCMP